MVGGFLGKLVIWLVLFGGVSVFLVVFKCFLIVLRRGPQASQFMFRGGVKVVTRPVMG